MKDQEIVGPILGTAATFAGLTLVFLGIVITAYQGYTSDIPASVRRPFRVHGSVVLLGLVSGVVAVGLDCAWFITRGTHPALFWWWGVAFFVAQIVLTIVGAGLVLRRVLWS
jgi:uncharacterized membrane protein